MRSNVIIFLWLKYFSEASIVAQDCTPCTDGSELELFKYFTKLITKVGKDYEFFPEQSDAIFQSMYKKRTYRAYGIKKQVSEEIEELQSVEIENLKKRFGISVFVDHDWYDVDTGEAISKFVPSDTYKQFVEHIGKSPPLPDQQEKRESPPDFQQIIGKATFTQRENDFYNPLN